MTAFSLAVRFLRRDWHLSEVRLLIAALILAVAGVTTVGFFTDRIQQAINLQGSEVLAADLVLESPSPLPAELKKTALQLGLQTADTLHFASVVMANDEPRLVQIKAVSANYPLRGGLRVADRLGAPDGPASGPPERGRIWAEPRLLSLMNLDAGDRLHVGETLFPISRVLTHEPDRSGNLFALAPRVLLHIDDIPQTGLVTPASRVKHRLLVAGAVEQLGDYRRRVEKRLASGIRLIDVRGARPELRIALRRGESFLGLASLTAVLLAGAAVALATRRFVERQADASAVFRCLGASRVLVLKVYLLRLIALSLGASLIGCILGYFAQFFLAWWLEGWFGGSLPPPSLDPLAAGFATGLATLIGFALPSVYRAGDVPPLRVLRRSLDAPSPGFRVLAICAGGVLAILVAWKANDAGLAAWSLVIVAVTLGLLIGGAVLLLRILAALRPRLGTVWRYGIMGLGRTPHTTVFQMAGFGLGIMALVLLAIVRIELLGNWRATLPPETPNRFLINIQPDQTEALAAFFRDEGVSIRGLYPMIRGRLLRINEHRVSPDDYEESRARRLADREFNLSWSLSPQADNKVVQGSWWNGNESSTPMFSVELGLAKTLGIKLGDDLTFLVAGREVAARVTSLRKVKWDSFNANFFVIGTPALLEDLPATFITSFHLGNETGGFGRELLQRFPGITILDVSAIMAHLRRIMDRGALAVEYVFLFTLLTGVLVLYAGIQAGAESRIRESGVLRSLGLKKKRLLQAVAVEFLVLGLIAGVLGTACANLAGYILAEEIFGLRFRFNPWVAFTGIGIGTLGVGIAGVLATYPLVIRPPLQVLRRA